MTETDAMPEDLSERTEFVDGIDAGANDVGQEPVTCLTFELLAQIFAIGVGSVREILDLQPISRLPNAPGELLGVIDVRGESIPVVDLAARLGLGRAAETTEGRIIVFELGDAASDAFTHVPVGVIADRVLSVVDLDRADIEPAPRAMIPWDGHAVRGIARIGGRIVLLLDLDSVFADTGLPRIAHP